MAGRRHPCSDQHWHISQRDGTLSTGIRETTVSALIFGNEASCSELMAGMDKLCLLTQDPSEDGGKVWILPSAPGTAADRQLSISHPPLEVMAEAESSNGSRCCCPRSQ